MLKLNLYIAVAEVVAVAEVAEVVPPPKRRIRLSKKVSARTAGMNSKENELQIATYDGELLTTLIAEAVVETMLIAEAGFIVSLPKHRMRLSKTVSALTAEMITKENELQIASDDGKARTTLILWIFHMSQTSLKMETSSFSHSLG